MWKKPGKDCYDSRSTSNEDKQKLQPDSQGDSGFLSGSSLISSEINIDVEGEERCDNYKIAPEPIANPVSKSSSHLDFGLTKGVKDLSLKEATALDTYDSGVINEEYTSQDDIETPLPCEEIKEEFKHEPQEQCENWEIYFTQDDDGDTQLHVSVVQGFVEAAFYLIDIAPHPCLLNILNDDAQTALHIAVLTHQPVIVRRLILAAADPTVRNFQGNTPLHLSCDIGNVMCARALSNPLAASEHKFYESAKYLPLLPQNLEQVNYEGQTCLHIAASKGHLDIVRHLLDLGADLTAREGLAGRTPLHLAIENNHRDVINFLLKESKLEQLEVQNYAGLTAYSVAYLCDNKELADELVKLGAKPSLPPAILTDEESDEEDEDIENIGQGEYRTPPLSEMCSLPASVATV